MEKNMETDYTKVFTVIFPCSMMYLDKSVGYPNGLQNVMGN